MKTEIRGQPELESRGGAGIGESLMTEGANVLQAPLNAAGAYLKASKPGKGA